MKPLKIKATLIHSPRVELNISDIDFHESLNKIKSYYKASSKTETIKRLVFDKVKEINKIKKSA